MQVDGPARVPHAHPVSSLPKAPHPSLRALRDPWPTRLKRRLVTVPVVLTAWLVATLLAPVLLPVALCADVLRARPRVLARTVVFFTLFLWCEAAGIAAAFILWLTLAWNDHHYLTANHRLQVWWNRALLFGGCKVFGMRLEVEGDGALAHGGPLLVFPRHVSTVDAVIPVSLLAQAGYRFRFVLKRALLSDPCLDIVGNRLPNFFSRRDSGNTEDEAHRVTSLLAGLSTTDAVVVFPEGTRFTPARRNLLMARAWESNNPRTLELASRLRHTLPPLTAGTLALLRENTGADVLFVAHTGLEGAGGFPDFIRGGLVGAVIRVKMWRVPYADIPHDDDGRTAFLAEHWQHVDDFAANRAG